MFIFNLKINSNKMYKLLLLILILIAILICGIVTYKVYKASIKSGNELENIKNDIVTIDDKNYTNILKMVHDNIDSYVGQKIKYSGFVYRVYDLENNQFILARNMIISSDLRTVVVGFLCDYKDAVKYKDKTWIEIEGEITKGTYQNFDMPVLKITSVKEIEKPKDEFVYPPDENYIPTSSII